MPQDAREGPAFTGRLAGHTASKRIRSTRRCAAGRRRLSPCSTPTQGWLGFGRPIFKTRPALEPERSVRPEPGLHVLFPSYLWHGTAPFTPDETQLSLAFDVLPA